MSSSVDHGATSAPQPTGHVRTGGLLALENRPKRHPVNAEKFLRKFVFKLAEGLPKLAAAGKWLQLMRLTAMSLSLTRHKNLAEDFLKARGTACVQEAIRAAAASEDPAASGMLQPATALLLQCVRLSESAAELVVESQSIRLLLQLLLRPDVGPGTKRHIAEILQALAATQLVYRDVLHGAGIVDVLLAALTDASSSSDLGLVQRLLWVLVSLSDDDTVYKDDMREAGLPALLVALFSVYQAHQGAPELRPIAAQILRCLHLMAADDAGMCAACAQLGLVPLLVNQLHLDIHSLDEPPLPPGAANILTLNSLPGTPRSPHKAAAAAGHAAAAAGSPASPLWRTSSGSSGSGASSPRTGSQAGGPSSTRRPSTVEPPIPEDSEADVALPESGEDGYSMLPTPLQGRAAFAPHGTEAAALRGLGMGPSPLTRVAAVLLLREVLSGVMSRATIEVLAHGLLLPALHTQLVGPRLSLAMEATATLLALLADSQDNQESAVKAGAVPLLVQLLAARNIDLASTSAEIITLLAKHTSGSSSTAATGLGGMTAAAVAGLGELLQECVAHAYALGLGRRRGSMDSTPSTSVTLDGRLSSRRSAGGDWLRSIPEDSRAAAKCSSSSADVNRAEQAPNVKQQAAHLLTAGSVAMRHPSLNRDGTPGAPGTLQQQAAAVGQYSASLLNAQLHHALSVRDRPRISAGSGALQCLVCSQISHESCGACPLSSVLTALSTLMAPQPELQMILMQCSVLEVLVGLAASETAGMEHSRLLSSLCGLLAVAVTGNSAAQDQVRSAGGIEVFGSLLARLAAAVPSNDDLQPLTSSLLHCLAALVADNNASKLSLREAGALAAVAELLDAVLATPTTKADSAAAVPPAGLALSVLELLAASLPGSPGNQAALHNLGVTGKLLALLRRPCSNPHVGLGTIQVLSLLGNKQQAGALAEVTAGGLVAVVMNILQQQAMDGVLVSEVCMKALPALLDGNPAGKAQALQYGVLPLLVHLLRSSPSAVTLLAAAHALAVLADKNTELQGQITAAGGLSALLDRLDPANNAAGQATAAAAAAAAAASAAEAVVKSAGTSLDGGAAIATGASSSVETEPEVQEDGCSSPFAACASSSLQEQQQAQSIPDRAAEVFSAVEGRSTTAAAAATTASQQQQQQQQQASPVVEEPAVAAARHMLGMARVRVACLEAVAALAHDNMFTKNMARQQGAMLLLRDLLSTGRQALQAAVTQQQQHAAQQLAKGSPHQLQQTGNGTTPAGYQLEPSWGERPGSAGRHNPLSQLRVRTSVKPGSSQGSSKASTPGQQLQELEMQLQQVQLQLLAAVVAVVEQLCHGCHANQQAAAAEGLLDQLAGLAALALGDNLKAAAPHGQLLAGVCNALSAAVEFCVPNKLVARESGAVDVLSRLLLMAAEVPDMDAELGSLDLYPAIAAACGAVVALAQDCNEQQRAFTDHPDVLPALFRLLGVNGPETATQAARALEFIAIRNDCADDADDRSEFEADTVLAFIRALSHGALAISGTGRAAAARVALGNSGTPSAAVIWEAAQLLGLVVDASDPANLPVAAAPASAGQQGVSNAGLARTGSSGTGSGNITMAGLGTAPAHPSMAAGNSAKHILQPSGGRTPAAAGQQEGRSAVGAAFAGDSGLISPGASNPLNHPAALMPSVVTDHTSGLAVLRTWSMREDFNGLWQSLVARTAPAFQPIRSTVPEGPWKPFKLQLGWMLLLLAVKSASNRSIISRVQRTTLTPLAMQLENAEKFYAQAAAVEVATEAASSVSSKADTPAVRSRTASLTSAMQHTAPASAMIPAAATNDVAPGLQQVGGSHSAHTAPDSSIAHADSLGGGSVEDDELLQAEVAFLGMMSSRSTSQTGSA